MEITPAALALNNIFASYDMAILKFLHGINNGFLTILFKLITFIGEKGIVFFLAAIILMCFSKTRKLGVCLFGAVACGALISNIILKDMVARPRPFEASETFRQWWIDVGAPEEDGFSFPSGHVTAAAAGMTSIWIMKGKKWALPTIIWVPLMMVARNYLMAHYPSDVLAAAIIGVISAFIAYLITRLIFDFLEDHCDLKACDFILYWDLPDFAGIPSRLSLISDDEDDEEEGFGREFKARAAAGRRRGNKGTPSIFDDLEEKPKTRKKVKTTQNIKSSESRYEGKRVAKNTSSKTAAKSKNRAGAGYVGKHAK